VILMGMTLTRHGNANTPPWDAALPYTTAAALGLAIGSVAAFPAPFRFGMPAVLLAAGLSRALDAYFTRERLRTRADAWLAETRLPNPAVFAWRVEELVGSERKVVGRTLRAVAEEVMRPHRRGAPILNRAQLRPETDLLTEIALALQDPQRPVSPRAIARTGLLITDCGSPLNCSARRDELHQALESILADISEPFATGKPGPHESPPQEVAAPRRTDRARRTRAGADIRAARSFTLSCGSATNESTASETER
jgi:hypothetical protein